jgi:U3 small nucleolar ribonucleoprotein component
LPNPAKTCLGLSAPAPQNTTIQFLYFNNQVKKQIAALEDSNVAAKSWQLTGEASAFTRPSNSLLEEILQFDHTSAAG